ncbi:MAG: VWA domain-containing protein [Pyrinomonadaceae bacterium]
MFLRKLALPLLSIAVFSLAGFGQSRRVAPTPTPTPKEDEPVRVLTEEIKLNVLAFDENGKFVPDVKTSDIVITENNILHQPTSVRRIPANVLIVMDTGGEMRQVKSLDQTRKTARAVVHALKPGDQVAILQYADAADIVSEWTDNRAQTLKAVDRTNFGRRSVFVNAIDRSIDFLVKSGFDNKHLVLITDGTDSNADARDKTRALNRLLSTDISVHVISYAQMEATDIAPRTKSVSNSPPPQALPPEIAAQLPNGARDVATAPKWKTVNMDRTMLRKLRARKADLEQSEVQLSKIAENTNGEMIVPTSLDEMVEKSALVAKMIDASYVVTYIPKIPLTEGSGDRNIDVTSKRAGLIIQAKRKLVIPAEVFQ